MSTPTRRNDKLETDYFSPNWLQVESAVLRAKDRYPRRKPKPSLVKPVLLGSLVLLASFVIAYLILGE